MNEPLTRGDHEAVQGEGPLALAIRRLDRALASLETTLGGPTAVLVEPDAGRMTALIVELDTARRRQGELEAAAADASHALGHAMGQVRRALEQDALQQGLLDFATEGLEPQPGSPEENPTETAAPPSEKEPAG